MYTIVLVADLRPQPFYVSVMLVYVRSPLLILGVLTI